MRKDLASARILVVDPSAYMAQVQRALLQEIGIARVLTVEDTLGALALLSEAKFDAILCDLATGPLTGLQFAALVRSSPSCLDPYIPLIMTGFQPSRNQVEAARDAGANEFLMKPVSARHLREKLLITLTAPRPFVRAHAYFGPDRRRKRDAISTSLDRRKTALKARKLARAAFASAPTPA